MLDAIDNAEKIRVDTILPLTTFVVGIKIDV